MICPGDVGGCDEQHGDTTMAGRRNELVDRPVFEHKRKYEHQEPKGVEDDRWRDMVVIRIGPDRAQEEHWKTVNRP